MKKARGKQVAGLVAGLTVEHATAFQDIFIRLKRAVGANSDAELADKIGLKRSSISTAKTRGMIPSSWIINAANLFNVSADWLIFGDEKFPDKAPKEAPPAPPPTAQTATKINPNYNRMDDEWALDLTPTEFKELWDRYWREKESRRGWLQVEITKRFPEFMEWLKSQPKPIPAPLPTPVELTYRTRNYDQRDQLEDD